jgi:glycosyltransferase involved in cell wall biosynthesis
MRPIRILVDSFADEGLSNAQMGNAREIIHRLDPDRFHVAIFVLGTPDPRIAARKNTKLIQLPPKRQTIRILQEFLLGSHDLLFYVKASPASRWYLKLRDRWRDRRVTIGTIESQCNLTELVDLLPEARRLWEETILRCDRLYSNSAYVQMSLHSEYGLNSDVIPTGADTQFFSPQWERTRNSRMQVLFVGSLLLRKHPELTLEAALRFPEADFRIVGEGPLRAKLESFILRHGLSNVVLVGAVTGKSLLEEYRHADIFFFPSCFEGSPKVIVEAAACGLPVICKDSYRPETVQHGITGYQATSDEELFVFLRALLTNGDLRSTLGRAGRRHSLQFDWDVITRQWEQTFCEIAGSQDLRYAS